VFISEQGAPRDAHVLGNLFSATEYNWFDHTQLLMCVHDGGNRPGPWSAALAWGGGRCPKVPLDAGPRSWVGRKFPYPSLSSLIMAHTPWGTVGHEASEGEGARAWPSTCNAPVGRRLDVRISCNLKTILWYFEKIVAISRKSTV
jgi:hypothetical protein